MSDTTTELRANPSMLLKGCNAWEPIIDQTDNELPTDPSGHNHDCLCLKSVSAIQPR